MYLKTNGKLVLHGKDETDVWEIAVWGIDTVFEAKKLHLKNDGNLVLLDQFNSVVWASATDSVCDQGLQLSLSCIFIEAATEGVWWKKDFLKISQISHENTCVGVSF